MSEAAGSEVKPNSEVVKEKKKELLARLFLEKIKSGEVKKENLEQQTLDNFSKILDWIKS
ncbi:MAG: hypothetical protein NTV36_02645 [Candidatus Staskawiczbacteria bacterium]|nr:hypothetical protein [Candidatus Staskawiczbacteria bacterium]